MNSIKPIYWYIHFLCYFLASKGPHFQNYFFFFFFFFGLVVPTKHGKTGSIVRKELETNFLTPVVNEYRRDPNYWFEIAVESDTFLFLLHYG